jgi:A/G-specific adenine glycosylase
MLQQTQVATVVPYFERFLARFPSVEELARSSEDDVLRLWAGLGYYSRARHLHRAAREIVSLGRFPETRAEWEAVSGVGPYTAGAILSISADRAEAILDGNVERVVSRLRRVTRKTDSLYKARLWRLSKVFVTRAAQAGVRPSVLNQALMELGATICVPRNPRCEACPLSDLCRARSQGDAPAFPPAKRPKEWIEVREQVHCWLGTGGTVCLRKRVSGEWREGLWDFMDRPPNSGRNLGSVETHYVVTRHRVRRETQIWRVKREPALLRAAEGSDEIQWVSAHAPEVAVGAPLKVALGRILEEFRPLSKS